MYKKQVRLRYMINDNENEGKNKKYITKIRQKQF